MRAIFWVLFVAAQTWVLCAIVRALLSWFPIAYDSAPYRINKVLVAITEPLIAPVRRILPTANMGSVGIDLSFLVVFLVLQIFVIPFLGRHAF